MGSYLDQNADFPHKMTKIGKAIDDIAAADQQVDIDIHMISDSIDIMADTSDSLSEYTVYLKEKMEKLKELTESQGDGACEVADEIAEIIDECNSLLLGFVEMSHELQNVVRNIASEIDEITELTLDVSEEFHGLVEKTSEI